MNCTTSFVFFLKWGRVNVQYLLLSLLYIITMLGTSPETLLDHSSGMLTIDVERSHLAEIQFLLLYILRLFPAFLDAQC